MTHTYHAPGITAGLAASCPRCAELAELIDHHGYTASPGFDDRKPRTIIAAPSPAQLAYLLAGRELPAS